MYRNYSDWEKDALSRMKHSLLKTFEHIESHKARNDGKAYSSCQLDDIEHIVNGMCKIHSLWEKVETVQQANCNTMMMSNGTMKHMTHA